jgi:putative aminopeptidase FrvX
MSRRPSLLMIIGLLAALAAPGHAQDATSEWNLLRQIIMIPGLSGQEGRVADFIQSRLPSAFKVQRDAMNNVWFTVGSGAPHILFVAHTDELGFTVGRVSPEGVVTLKGAGGFLPQTLEGQPFVIHTDKGEVEGVIRPRPDYDAAQPQPFAPQGYEMDIGAASEPEVRALGVAEGNPVIYKKVLLEPRPGLLAGRAVDDRAGCAALLAAVLQADWSKVKGKTVTCAWSVQEEVGLVGATALAKALKPDYVFAIDTFVSSDSPLESKRFAEARLGRGAVVRAMDSSGLTPKPGIDRLRRLAEARSLSLQVSDSRGGNDGSVFVVGGAVNIPLSWPGAYAHSFIEKIDRRDLGTLTLLIRAVITDF